VTKNYYYFRTVQEAKDFVEQGQKNQSPDVSYSNVKEFKPGVVKDKNGHDLMAAVEVTVYSFD
jgi:hypothetical protein